MACPKRHKENSGKDSEQGMEQGIEDIEECGITKRREVGAVRDQKEAENEKPLR